MVDELVAKCRTEKLRENTADAPRQTLDRPNAGSVAAKIYKKLAGCWGLSPAEAPELIGVPEREHRRWDTGNAYNPDILELEKVHFSMGIYQDRGALYPGHFDRINRWLLRRNDGDSYRGKTPYDLLVGASRNVFYLVWQQLAAETV